MIFSGQQQVHFIGFSLGTLVNAAAANYLHGDSPVNNNEIWPPTRTHATLLDQAEIAAGIGQMPLFSRTFVPPVPGRSAWADNYVSAYARYEDQAANVFLQKAFWLEHGNGAGAHAYAHDWYTRTIATPERSAMGHGNSFERLGALPLAGSYQRGAAYKQRPSASDDLALDLMENTWEVAALQVGMSTRVLPGLGVAGTEWAITTAGEVLADVVESVVNALATEEPWPVSTPAVIGIPGYVSPNEFLNSWSLQLRLNTQPPTPLNPLVGRGKDGEPLVTNAPAYVWLPVTVPSNAALMAFQFSLAGDGKDDRVAFGLNGTNLFSLEAQFLEENVPASSGPIDVSRWAGQRVELFFGLVGGTSTNASLTVNGIRFYEVAPPALLILRVGNECVVRWPWSVSGFVLESTGALSATNAMWATVTNAPVVVDFLNTVTNDVSGGSRFYRLRRQP